MYHSKKKMTHGGKMKNNGNASARREPMMYGGMKKMKGGGMTRTMLKDGGMPKAKPC